MEFKQSGVLQYYFTVVSCEFKYSNPSKHTTYTGISFISKRKKKESKNHFQNVCEKQAPLVSVDDDKPKKVGKSRGIPVSSPLLSAQAHKDHVPRD